jgi:hypothetical protein
MSEIHVSPIDALQQTPVTPETVTTHLPPHEFLCKCARFQPLGAMARTIAGKATLMFGRGWRSTKAAKAPKWNNFAEIENNFSQKDKSKKKTERYVTIKIQADQ